MDFMEIMLGNLDMGHWLSRVMGIMILKYLYIDINIDIFVNILS